MGRAKRRKRSMLGHVETIIVPQTAMSDDGRRFQRDPDGALYELRGGTRRRIRGDDATRAFERAVRDERRRRETHRAQRDAKRIAVERHEESEASAEPQEAAAP